MPQIQVLDERTIDQIAAGEVVERPSSVVKELVENAIDAGADAVTVEIKDGGITFIRITDNGQGIPKAQVPLAFLRHATSKIRSIEDLLTVSSLGFRGEALSSIAAVSQVELITKVSDELTGTAYRIEGSKEKGIEDIGAPNGTTFLIRNLFYNTPARQKFLKSPPTEASYIGMLMERLALSHPDISFQFIANGQLKLHTNGSAQLKDIIYHIYGRDIAAGVFPLHAECGSFSLDGMIGKPFISRGNRNYETYFINGRYIKSTLISKSIEDAYKPFLMKHQYPFTVLQLTMDSTRMDVNVHPSKMEIRFQQGEEIYRELVKAVRDALEHVDIIPEVPAVESDKKKTKEKQAALSENKKIDSADAADMMPIYAMLNPADTENTSDAADTMPSYTMPNPANAETLMPSYTMPNSTGVADAISPNAVPNSADAINRVPIYAMPDSVGTENAVTQLHTTSRIPEYQNLEADYAQLTLAESNSYHADFIQEAKRRNYTIIGQVFETYWLVQVENELFIIDQHAAHEKVLYEMMMAQLSKREFTSQQLSPPVIITMTLQEEELFHKYEEQFTRIGFEVNPFGGREYAICAVPANLYSLNQKGLFLDMLDGLSQEAGKNNTPDIILEKIASMSCKAAVKGSQRLSRAEAEHLLADLLELENPYNCPHGRPTIISMSKTEIEKKFKRIV